MPGAVTKDITLEIPGSNTVTGRVSAPLDPMPDAPALLLAHGANNDLDHPLLVYVAAGLARSIGATVLRFNFPYAERGDKPAADSPDVLMKAFRHAYLQLTEREAPAGVPAFVGGKSLGGRIAAELISRRPEGDGLQTMGLVQLGYPLHAPGRTDKINLKPLRHIDVPSLFCEGTRDAFCDLDFLRPVLPNLLAPAELYVVEGGDHSLLLPRSSGRAADAAYPEIVARLAHFLTAVSLSTSAD